MKALIRTGLLLNLMLFALPGFAAIDCDGILMGLTTPEEIMSLLLKNAMTSGRAVQFEATSAKVGGPFRGFVDAVGKDSLGVASVVLKNDAGEVRSVNIRDIVTSTFQPVPDQSAALNQQEKQLLERLKEAESRHRSVEIATRGALGRVLRGNVEHYRTSAEGEPGLVFLDDTQGPVFVRIRDISPFSDRELKPSAYATEPMVISPFQKAQADDSLVEFQVKGWLGVFKGTVDRIFQGTDGYDRVVFLDPQGKSMTFQVELIRKLKVLGSISSTGRLPRIKLSE